MAKVFKSYVFTVKSKVASGVVPVWAENEEQARAALDAAYPSTMYEKTLDKVVDYHYYAGITCN